MKVLVTGSAGHLGEALMRALPDQGLQPVGLDIKASPFTQFEGSATDRELVRKAISGAQAVLHTATLHKPHVATHAKQAFIDTNISGTLVLLEEALNAGVKSFVFTSTTSVFGDALRPPQGSPAAWITEKVQPIPKNIYGITKSAAEDLCYLFYKKHQLPGVVLRTSRFFPEADDSKAIRSRYADANAKTSEFLYRRVDVEDIVSAHILAARKAPDLGFERFIISATTPFRREDLHELRVNPDQVVKKYCPQYESVYADLNWRMFDDIERVYVNEKARRLLGWEPSYNFDKALVWARAGRPPRSDLAEAVGMKGYHDEVFEEGPYPVD